MDAKPNMRKTSLYMTKQERISSYTRKLFLIYECSSVHLLIFSYTAKIYPHYVYFKGNVSHSQKRKMIEYTPNMWRSDAESALTTRNILNVLQEEEHLNSLKTYRWLRPRSIHACHQTPNLPRDTFPFNQFALHEHENKVQQITAILSPY